MYYFPIISVRVITLGPYTNGLAMDYTCLHGSITRLEDRAITAGELFSLTMLSSFIDTPEERTQIAQDLATIERGDAESTRRRTQYDDLHDQINSAVEQCQDSIHPFTHFMPSWPSLSAHEQQHARNTVCAINEEAIAPTRLTWCKADEERQAAQRAALETLSPSSADDEAIMRDFKNDIIHKRFENGEQRFREWCTSSTAGEERELYKRAIREINADSQGWQHRGSEVRPMDTRVDPLEAMEDAEKLARCRLGNNQAA